MTDHYDNRPSIDKPKASSLTHYRFSGSTYIDTGLWETDFTNLTSAIQGAYIRMLTGPWHEIGVGLNFSAYPNEIMELSNASGMDIVRLCTRLRDAGLIKMDGNTATFPNVIYGPPPCHGELGPGEYCSECGTINPEGE